MKSLVNMTLGLVAAGVVSSLVACGPSGNKPNVELIQDMMESPAIKAQEYDESSPNHSGMRVPPEGTVPQGFTPYRYKGDVEGAAKNLQNPMAGKMDTETLLVGQKFYDTNCMVCHGQKGEGGVAAKMPVSDKMALKPPAMTSDKIKGWTDGYIYHVISEGQGVMGPYAPHIPQKYRWQVVNYIRFLQKQSTEK